MVSASAAKMISTAHAPEYLVVHSRAKECEDEGAYSKGDSTTDQTDGSLRRHEGPGPGVLSASIAH